MKKIKSILFVLLSIVIFLTNTDVSFAYYDRGDVGITLGQSNISLEIGGSASVSVALSPEKDRQLPGCGMPECPQACGEGCLDENGQCTCGGTEYQTYYTSVDVSSTNTSVATAAFVNGALVINALNEGEATITATASLRQFTSTSKNLKVTVKAKENNNNSNNSNSDVKPDTPKNNSDNTNKKDDKNNQNKKITVNTNENKNTENNDSDNNASSITENSTKENQDNSNDSVVDNIETSEEKIIAKEETNEEAENVESTESEDSKLKVIDSKKGRITYVEIGKGKMGKQLFEKIKGSDEYLNFQCTNKKKIVGYAWKFFGKDVKDAFDVDLNIDISQKKFKNCKDFDESNSVFIRTKADKLPGKAKVFIDMADYFEDGKNYSFYKYDEDNEKVILINDDIKIASGYAKVSLEKGGNYILSKEKDDKAVLSVDEIDKKSGSFKYAAILPAGILLMTAAAVFVYRKKKVK
ncbi:hypothetical protein SAMN05216249_10642 [Acetitomaculum ruminis DSM 5522]|uniref:Uncharacterized protein n=1 Tax=Acetitomaculum ruminis DSM 5522 TaxID=1120918 RepID=A0A1I0X9X4_9FIRM|nr:hypothetical protein [Acetitomaculum ruminis]SFA97751.1 hypothetical protein SAMN05216249_10642 [Acetitomaculum ruminis DSM 5522]